MAAVGSYLYLAEKDFRAARNSKASGDYDVSGRLLEQTAEKALKHYLHHYGDPTNPADEKLLRSYKPYNIYTRCVELGLPLTLDVGEKSMLKSLGDWYYDTNYPNNNYTELTRPDIEEAEVAVEKIFAFITNLRMQIIHTQRLLLQAPTQADLDAIAAIWGDPECGKYLPDPYYKSGAEIAEILEDDPTCPVYYFVARRWGSDEIIGTCSLGLESAQSLEYSIGYTVKKDEWGKGYAGEMVHALIDFARTLGIKSLLAPIAQVNKASQRVAEKCGFSIAGESAFTKNGTDTVFPTFIYKFNL
ncbi:MAG: GNAT family N-acetyltransferase [Defluviitaleaceae bacterium]|nr:GNAT family N-acetyltransferase [Defluviitaleaceae bacterium]MCL2239979.1 GNAT family N-acetyltransferase [Defluviitaleaceae bacterium]